MGRDPCPTAVCAMWYLCVSAIVLVLLSTTRDDACPLFTRQCLDLPHELAHCVNPRWGKLVNIALLSLMRRVALPSSRTNTFVGRPDRVTREAGRVDLMGRNGGARVLSDVVRELLYPPLIGWGIKR